MECLFLESLELFSCFLGTWFLLASESSFLSLLSHSDSSSMLSSCSSTEAFLSLLLLLLLGLFLFSDDEERLTDFGTSASVSKASSSLCSFLFSSPSEPLLELCLLRGFLVKVHSSFCLFSFCLFKKLLIACAHDNLNKRINWITSETAWFSYVSFCGLSLFQHVRRHDLLCAFSSFYSEIRVRDHVPEYNAILLSKTCWPVPSHLS